MQENWFDYFKNPIPKQEKELKEENVSKKISYPESGFGYRELYLGLFGDLNIDIEDRRAFIDHAQEGENMDFKRWLIQELFARKEKIQTADSAAVKDMKDKGHTFFTAKKKWPKAISEYRDTWRHLRAWAQAAKIWNESDEQIFLKEVGNPDAETRLDEYIQAYNTRVMGALLLGPAYFAYYNVKMPFAAFRFALKHILPFFLDQQTTNKMIEAITAKKRPEEKPKKKAKNKEAEEAKVFETRQKVKDIQWKYLTGLKDQIIEEEIDKLPPEKQHTLTPEERKDLLTLGEHKYAKLLFNARARWIREKIWTQGSEEKFRKELNLDPENSVNERYVYLMTDQERNLIYNKREQKKKRQNELGRGVISNERKNELEEELKEVKGSIEQIKTDQRRRGEMRRLQRQQNRIERELHAAPLTEQERAHLILEINEIDAVVRDIHEEALRRAREMQWPPYGQQRGRRRRGQQGDETMEALDVENENEEVNNENT